MLLWQGVRKGKRSHDEADEEEEGQCEGKLADEEEADEEEEGHCKGKEKESEKDDEEKEGHLIPLGKKISQHHKSCSKKQYSKYLAIMQISPCLITSMHLYICQVKWNLFCS